MMVRVRIRFGQHGSVHNCKCVCNRPAHHSTDHVSRTIERPRDGLVGYREGNRLILLHGLWPCLLFWGQDCWFYFFTAKPPLLCCWYARCSQRTFGNESNKKRHSLHTGWRRYRRRLEMTIRICQSHLKKCSLPALPRPPHRVCCVCLFVCVFVCLFLQ